MVAVRRATRGPGRYTWDHWLVPMSRLTLPSLLLLIGGCAAAPDPERIPEYVNTLTMPVSHEEKREARRCLLALGEPAVPHLARALGAESDDYPGWVTLTLASMGPIAASACPELLDQMRGAEEMSWSASKAGYALAQIGQPAVPHLVDALEDEDTMLRRHVLVAFSWMGPDVDLGPAMAAVVGCWKTETLEGDLQTASLASLVIDARFRSWGDLRLLGEMIRADR